MSTTVRQARSSRGPHAPETIAVVLPHLLRAPSVEAGAPGGHGAALERVLSALSDAVPLLHVRGGGTVLTLARGPSRFHGSVRAAAERFHSLCREADVGPVGVGVAAGQFAATVAAHCSADSGMVEIVDPGESAGFVASLPVGWLAVDEALDPGCIGTLGRLGLARLAAVRDLGERALVDRFGAEGRRIHVLASGGDPEPLAPTASAEQAAATWRCEPDEHSTGTTVSAVLGAARGACEEMLRLVAARGEQCIAVRITAESDDGPVSDRVWHEPRGLTPRAVLDRLGHQIGGGSAGVLTQVSFVAVGTRPVSATQGHLWQGREISAERAMRALAAIRAIDGPLRVGVPRRRGTRDVLEAWSLEDASRVDLADASAARERIRGRPADADPWPGSLPSPSPAAIWNPCPVVEITDADGAAVGVTGRHELTAVPAWLVLGARRLEVLAHAGPWPLEERWWDPRRHRRVARLQLLVRDGTGETVHLVHLERGAWRAVARYD